MSARKTGTSEGKQSKRTQDKQSGAKDAGASSHRISAARKVQTLKKASTTVATGIQSKTSGTDQGNPRQAKAADLKDSIRKADEDSASIAGPTSSSAAICQTALTSTTRYSVSRTITHHPDSAAAQSHTAAASSRCRADRPPVLSGMHPRRKGDSKDRKSISASKPSPLLPRKSPEVKPSPTTLRKSSCPQLASRGKKNAASDDARHSGKTKASSLRENVSEDNSPLSSDPCKIMIFSGSESSFESFEEENLTTEDFALLEQSVTPTGTPQRHKSEQKASCREKSPVPNLDGCKMGSVQHKPTLAASSSMTTPKKQNMKVTRREDQEAVLIKTRRSPTVTKGQASPTANKEENANTIAERRGKSARSKKHEIVSKVQEEPKKIKDCSKQLVPVASDSRSTPKSCDRTSRVTNDHSVDKTIRAASDLFDNRTSRAASDLSVDRTIRAASDLFDNRTSRAASDLSDNRTIRAASDISDNRTTRAVSDLSDSITTRAASDFSDSRTTRAASDLSDSITTRAASDLSDSRTIRAASDLSDNRITRAGSDLSESRTTKASSDLSDSRTTKAARTTRGTTDISDNRNTKEASYLSANRTTVEASDLFENRITKEAIVPFENRTTVDSEGHRKESESKENQSMSTILPYKKQISNVELSSSQKKAVASQRHSSSHSTSSLRVDLTDHTSTHSVSTQSLNEISPNSLQHLREFWTPSLNCVALPHRSATDSKTSDLSDYSLAQKEGKDQGNDAAELTEEEEVVVVKGFFRDRRPSAVYFTPDKAEGFPWLNWSSVIHPDQEGLNPSPQQTLEAACDHSYILNLILNVGDVIGQGQYGTVYAASLRNPRNLTGVSQSAPGQRMALKKLNKVDRESTVHALAEQRALQMSKDCPFIVTMFSCFQTKLAFYLLLERAEGGCLSEVLRQTGRLPEHNVRFYAAQMLVALSYLHQKDILHRDLKMENVLLDAAGYIRLCDFGLSMDGFRDGDQVCSPCGTLFYVAPEVLRGEPYGKAADWWSYGVILYCMATGKLPFEGPNIQALYIAVTRKEPVYPSFLSHSLISFTRKTFSLDKFIELLNLVNECFTKKSLRWYPLIIIVCLLLARDLLAKVLSATEHLYSGTTCLILSVTLKNRDSSSASKSRSYKKNNNNLDSSSMSRSEEDSRKEEIGTTLIKLTEALRKEICLGTTLVLLLSNEGNKGWC